MSNAVLGDLFPGAPPIEIVVTGTLASDFAGDELTNTAALTSDTTDPLPDNDSSTWTSEVDSEASLVVTKTGQASAVAGGPIAWTVTVTNSGPSLATAVTMSDPLPAGVLGASATTDVGTCDATVSCQLGALAVGATATISISGTVDPAQPAGSISNVATAASPDAVPSDPIPPVVTEITRSADLSIVKSLSAGGVVAGGPVSWTLTVVNAGPSTAQSVVVTDPLPAAVLGATATSTAGACTVSGGVVSCALDTVAVGAPVTITISGTLAGDFRGTLTNIATVSSPTADPASGNSTSTATSSVSGSIDLTIAKTVDRAQGLIGTTATFTVSVSNVGPSSAANVAVDDQLPAGLTFVAARPSVGTFDTASRRWAVGSLAAGATAQLQIDVALNQAGTFTNVATIGQDPTLVAQVLPGSEETRTDNNTASATIEVITGELPATGANTGRTVELAMLVLLAGVALLLLVRRRRAH